MKKFTSLFFLLIGMFIPFPVLANENLMYEGLCVKVGYREDTTTYYFGRYCYYPEIGQVCREPGVFCWDKHENPVVFKRLRNFICTRHRFLKQKNPKIFGRICPNVK
ncbi:hypothetical protein [Phorcysia thermohydrogeniphila]|uniref:Uncharacterized protein n=1 Tax=Phorcysia thermohydrogeniphila TaxID=936138 RepID=A0A4R1GI07_9BACT|nr:hypothetical protein [Phorcysia thermohydrogeniphila]TCK06710.1 hypothetical protein CLV27_0520 [Phorcysia thermohydrogeniphila]